MINMNMNIVCDLNVYSRVPYKRGGGDENSRRDGTIEEKLKNCLEKKLKIVVFLAKHISFIYLCGQCCY